MHADQFDAWPDAPGCNRNAGRQPAAADRNDQHVEVAHLLQHLQRHGPLTGDHRRVVIGMDECQAALLTVAPRKLRGILERRPLDNDISAEPAGILNFDVGRADRHDDGRRQSQQARVIGHALRVVAGRHRYDPPARGVQGQRRKSIARTTLLERCRELVVLELQPEFAAQDIGQRPRDIAGRNQRMTAQHVARLHDIVIPDGKTRCISLLHHVIALPAARLHQTHRHFLLFYPMLHRILANMPLLESNHDKIRHTPARRR